MINTPLSLLVLLLSLSCYSSPTKESLKVSAPKNDTINVDEDIEIEEHFRNNVVLMPLGIYDGYLPYVHELVRSDYSNNGKYREYISRKIPKGYMLFINLKDWSNYLKKNEPSFSANLQKYAELSESSRELYINKYKASLEELQEIDREQGNYSFKRAVVVSYLKALGSGNVFSIPHNHYMVGEYDAGIDENPLIRVKLEEQVKFSIELKNWRYFLNKYDLPSDIKKVRKVQITKNIDSIVNYNEKLSSEKQELEHYKELIEWKEGVDSGNIFLNIEQFEAHLKEMQRNFPGKFQNKQRIENQRKLELEKLDYYKNFEYEYCIAKENNLFPEDITLKILRLEILQYFLSAEWVYPDDLWVLNYPDFEGNPKEIAYQVEYYEDYERPEALYFGERPKP